MNEFKYIAIIDVQSINTRDDRKYADRTIWHHTMTFCRLMCFRLCSNRFFYRNDTSWTTLEPVGWTGTQIISLLLIRKGKKLCWC